MNRYISIIVGCFLLTSCSTQEYELIEGTGIKGTVMVGNWNSQGLESDCEYESYNGFLYFLDKADTDAHITTSNDLEAVIAHMKGHSYTTWVGYGTLDCKAPVGEYYLATRDDYNFSLGDEVSIEEGLMLEVAIIFNDCPRP